MTGEGCLLMRRGLLLCLAISACSERTQIALNYELTGIDLGAVVRVETYIAVDPKDNRNFFADSPYRTVATGVGYEVRDFDGSGHRKVLVTHDNTLGFQFGEKFTFTLLPPSGETAPPLIVTARAVGAAAMLGRTQELPTHFAVNASLKVPLTDERCNGIACAGDEACCDQACTNPSTDAKNCGGCGKPCAPLGDSCQGGTCLCAGGSACTGAKTCCPSLGCIDLNSDPFNCGGCGHACNSGETCSGGVCQCNGGNACGDNGLCCATTGCSTTGSCACGASSCAAPSFCCDSAAGTCVNLMNDNNNCGACGKVCATGLLCDKGACKCNGQICSTGDACCSTGCANTQSSTANCGSCGHGCGMNEVCSGGTCKCGMAACAAGESCCGTTCKNLDNDAANCGACGKTCNAGEQCQSGKCVCPGTSPARACTGTETCCGSNNGSTPGCFDLSIDHDHCSQCGKKCGGSEVCTAGVCKATACNPSCDHGNRCDTNTLSCMCGNGQGCAGALYCCNGVCVDRSSNTQNCGSCGTNVAPNLCCGGQSTPHNNANCSACGIGCGLGQICCQAGSTVAFDCVSNLDTKNCGSCGNSCSGSSDGFQVSAQCCTGCLGGAPFCSSVCPDCPVGGGTGPTGPAP